MNKQDVVDFIAHGFTLASLPDSFQQLNELSRDSHADIDDVVAIIRQDVELSANLMRLSSAPLYSRGQSVTSIEEAAQKLGMRIILESSLALGIINAIEIDPTYFDLHSFWKRSLSIAYLSETVHGFMPHYLQGKTSASALFTAGLLHDMGLLVLMQGFPETMMEIVDTALNDDQPLYEAEYEKLGFSHQEVGRVLFKKWNLPEQFLAVAAYHHRPLELPKRLHSVIVDVIHIADFICANRTLYQSRTAFKPVMQEAVWKRAAISMVEVPDIAEKADLAFESAEALLCC